MWTKEMRLFGPTNIHLEQVRYDFNPRSLVFNQYIFNWRSFSFCFAIIILKDYALKACFMNRSTQSLHIQLLTLKLGENCQSQQQDDVDDQLLFTLNLVSCFTVTILLRAYGWMDHLLFPESVRHLSEWHHAASIFFLLNLTTIWNTSLTSVRLNKIIKLETLKSLMKFLSLMLVAALYAQCACIHEITWWRGRTTINLS